MACKYLADNGRESILHKDLKEFNPDQADQMYLSTKSKFYQKFIELNPNIITDKNGEPTLETFNEFSKQLYYYKTSKKIEHIEGKLGLKNIDPIKIGNDIVKDAEPILDATAISIIKNENPLGLTTSIALSNTFNYLRRNNLYDRSLVEIENELYLNNSNKDVINTILDFIEKNKSRDDIYKELLNKYINDDVYKDLDTEQYEDVSDKIKRSVRKKYRTANNLSHLTIQKENNLNNELGIVRNDLDYDRVNVNTSLKEKKKILDKFKIKKIKSHYYYVLNVDQQRRVDNWLKAASRNKDPKKREVGSTKKGFDLQGGEYQHEEWRDGNVTLRIDNGKQYLYIENTDEILETSDPEYVFYRYPITGVYKIPIKIIGYNEEATYLKSQKENTLYTPFLEKEINKYLLKTKNVGVKKSANWYLLQIKTLIKNSLLDIANKEYSYEDLKNLSVDDKNTIYAELKIDEQINEIKTKFKNYIDTLDKKELINEIIDLYSEHLKDNTNDIKQLEDLLNSFPDSFLKLITFKYVNLETAFFTTTSKLNTTEYDSLFSLSEAYDIQIKMSLNVALKNLKRDGILDDNIINTLNEIIRPGIEKYIKLKQKNERVAECMKPFLIRKLATIKKYSNIDIDTLMGYWDEAANETKLESIKRNKGLATLTHDIFNNLKNVNSVFSEIQIGELNSSNLSFEYDKTTVIMHELGHAFDKYMFVTNNNKRDDIIKFITNLKNTDEFQNYLKKGLKSRGYSVTNDKEILADLYAYIIGKSIGKDFKETHLESIAEFFETHMKLAQDIFNNSYGFEYSNVENKDVYNIPDNNIFNTIRKYLNDFIEYINTILKINYFKPFTISSKEVEVQNNNIQLANLLDTLKSAIFDESNFNLDNILNSEFSEKDFLKSKLSINNVKSSILQEQSASIIGNYNHAKKFQGKHTEVVNNIREILNDNPNLITNTNGILYFNTEKLLDLFDAYPQYILDEIADNKNLVEYDNTIKTNFIELLERELNNDPITALKTKLNTDNKASTVIDNHLVNISNIEKPGYVYEPNTGLYYEFLKEVDTPLLNPDDYTVNISDNINSFKLGGKTYAIIDGTYVVDNSDIITEYEYNMKLKKFKQNFKKSKITHERISSNSNTHKNLLKQVSQPSKELIEKFLNLDVLRIDNDILNNKTVEEQQKYFFLKNLLFANGYITSNNGITDKLLTGASLNPKIKIAPNKQVDFNKVDTKLADKIQKILQEKYPEIKLNITNNPIWEQGDNVFNQEEYQNQVNYRLKAVDILLSDKAKQVFEKGKKVGWDVNKILTELQVPKEQKQIILDKNLENNKPNVILPIGTSGSGKSTFIKSLLQKNLVVIEPDAMRVEFTGDINNKSKDKEIYEEAAKRAVTAIKQGKQVVFDTTNLTKGKRLPFIEAIKKSLPNTNIQYKLMELNPELAKQRIKAQIERGENRANVPDSTIDRHAESYKQMLEDIKSEPISNYDTDLREEILTSLLAENSFVVEVNTAKIPKGIYDPTDIDNYDPEYMENNKSTGGENSNYYSELTVPGGTNYTENEISTPDITPKIKGHARFSTDSGIGWFRSDDKEDTKINDITKIPNSFIAGIFGGTEISYKKENDIWNRYYDGIFNKTATENEVIIRYNTNVDNTNKTRRILEVQSDLFQKGRNEYFLTEKEGEQTILGTEIIDSKENQFLQLLNKKGNWVTFFVKSIIQDSAKKGYEKVLFPKGDTAAKIEGHQTSEEFKREKEKRIEILKKNYDYLDEEYDIVKDSLPKEVTRVEFIESQGKSFLNEIKTLKQEIADVESGQTQLSSIAKFYENTVANILKKQGYNPVEITDEYGNKWNEITITPKHLSEILLQKDEANKIIGQANIKAGTVLIDALNLKQDTLSHEYAHHYIAWFRDSDIVQEGIKRFGSEEALVQAIGEQVVKQEGEAYNWWKKFTNWIVNILSDKEVLQVLTDSFLNRTDLTNTTPTTDTINTTFNDLHSTFDNEYQQITEKEFVDADLDFNQKVTKGFLKDFNIDTAEYQSLKETFGYDATQMVDLPSKFVAYEQGEILDKTTAFIAYKLLGKNNNKIRRDLRYNIYQWSGFKKHWDYHSAKLNQEKGFISDKKTWRGIIRDRVIVDFLAQTIVEYHKNPVEFEKINDKIFTKADFTYFQKLRDLIIDILDKLTGRTNPKRIERLNLIALNIADEVLNNEYDIYNYELAEDQVQKYYDETIAQDPIAKKIVEYHQNAGIILTGSLSLRKLGGVYRTEKETLHDLDFTVPSDVTTDDRNSNITHQITQVTNEMKSIPNVNEIYANTTVINLINNYPWFADFLKQYPDYKVVRGFYGSDIYNNKDYSQFTLTGVIGGEFYKENGKHDVTWRDGSTHSYKHKKGDWIDGTGHVIDHFIRLDHEVVSHKSYFNSWQDTMKAKLMMSRPKDLIDYKAFIPFVKPTDGSRFKYPDYIYTAKTEKFSNKPQFQLIQDDSSPFQKMTYEQQQSFEKTIRDLSARMSYRIGIPYKIENRKDKKYKGKIENDTAYINLAYATLDTSVHEILGHPIIRAIKNKTIDGNTYRLPEKMPDSSVWTVQVYTKDNFEPEFFKTEKEAFDFYNSKQTNLYQNLLKELETGKGKEVLDRIKRDYSSGFKGIYGGVEISYFEENGKWYKTFDNERKTETTKEEAEQRAKLASTKLYTLEEQQEEAIVELLGLYTADRLDKVKDGKLISLLKRLLKEMKSFIRNLFNQKEVEIDKLPDNITINDLADLLAYSNSKLILPGYEVEYTTPDDNKFKTYQEASNHISQLVKNVKDVDLENVNIDLKLATKLTDIRVDGFPGLMTVDINTTYYKENNKWFKAAEVVEWDENEDPDFQEPIITEATVNEVLEWYNKQINELDHNNIREFIEKNKEYEQSKEIIEEWKKVNNIVYNPEEVYSRSQEFISVVGAYSDFDVELMFQNLLAHIEDNEKAGGQFAISALTKPVDTRLRHIEGTGGKIRFKITPESEDILWASNIDVYSGSVWYAAEKVNKDKKSELLGVSYSKYPGLGSVNTIQPNLANIIDNINHHHNELGIVLTGNNFRLDYDDDIPYSTKKLIDGVNSILDQKYGKQIKPEIKKKESKKVYIVTGEFNLKKGNSIVKEFNTKEEAENWIKKESVNYEKQIGVPLELGAYILQGVQPAQTKDNLKESIESIKNKVSSNLGEGYLDTLKVQEYNDYFDGISINGFTIENYGNSPILDELIVKESIFNTMEEATNRKNELIKEATKIYNDRKNNQKEYTSQALINTKIAALKEVAKKYPRSLIRSEVKKSKLDNKSESLFGADELPFQKINNNELKKQIQDDIQGTSKESKGNLIQTVTNYLKESNATNNNDSRSTATKEQESIILEKFITDNNLWTSITDNMIVLFDEGAESTVYMDEQDLNNVFKENTLEIYENYSEFFNSLKIHNILFPDTFYEIEGFKKVNNNIHIIVKQPYIDADRSATESEIKSFMNDNGFVLEEGSNIDFINEKLGVIVEDLHSANVLVKNDILFFIDTVNTFSVENIKAIEFNDLQKQIVHIADKLAERTGINMTYVNNKNLNYKAKVNGNEITINLAKATLDTPVHEILHPFIAIIKDINLPLYNRLIRELQSSPIGARIINETRKKYKYKLDDEGNPHYDEKATPNENDVLEEALIETIGRLSKSPTLTEMFKTDNKGFLEAVKSFWNRLTEYVRSLITDKKQSLIVSDLDADTTIKDIAFMMNLDNSIGVKSPNNKLSKLSIAQWKMVRSDNFKDFFGDWELAVSQYQNKEFKTIRESLIANNVSLVFDEETLEPKPIRYTLTSKFMIDGESVITDSDPTPKAIQANLFLSITDESKIKDDQYYVKHNDQVVSSEPTQEFDLADDDIYFQLDPEIKLHYTEKIKNNVKLTDEQKLVLSKITDKTLKHQESLILLNKDLLLRHINVTTGTAIADIVLTEKQQEVLEYNDYYAKLKLDGTIEYLSNRVSNVVGSTFDRDRVYAGYTDEQLAAKDKGSDLARDAGTELHSVMQAIIEGKAQSEAKNLLTLFNEDVRADVYKNLKQLEQDLTEDGSLLLSEIMVHSKKGSSYLRPDKMVAGIPVKGITGTIDIIRQRPNGSLETIDIKTSGTSSSASVLYHEAKDEWKEDYRYSETTYIGAVGSDPRDPSLSKRAKRTKKESHAVAQLMYKHLYAEGISDNELNDTINKQYIFHVELTSNGDHKDKSVKHTKITKVRFPTGGATAAKVNTRYFLTELKTPEALVEDNKNRVLKLLNTGLYTNPRTAIAELIKKAGTDYKDLTDIEKEVADEVLNLNSKDSGNVRNIYEYAQNVVDFIIPRTSNNNADSFETNLVNEAVKTTYTQLKTIESRVRGVRRKEEIGVLKQRLDDLVLLRRNVSVINDLKLLTEFTRGAEEDIDHYTGLYADTLRDARTKTQPSEKTIAVGNMQVIYEFMNSYDIMDKIYTKLSTEINKNHDNKSTVVATYFGENFTTEDEINENWNKLLTKVERLIGKRQALKNQYKDDSTRLLAKWLLAGDMITENDRNTITDTIENSPNYLQERLKRGVVDEDMLVALLKRADSDLGITIMADEIITSDDQVLALFAKKIKNILEDLRQEQLNDEKHLDSITREFANTNSYDVNNPDEFYKDIIEIRSLTSYKKPNVLTKELLIKTKAKLLNIAPSLVTLSDAEKIVVDIVYVKTDSNGLIENYTLGDINWTYETEDMYNKLPHNARSVKDDKLIFVQKYEIDKYKQDREQVEVEIKKKYRSWERQSLELDKWADSIAPMRNDLADYLAEREAEFKKDYPQNWEYQYDHFLSTIRYTNKKGYLVYYVGTEVRPLIDKYINPKWKILYDKDDNTISPSGVFHKEMTDFYKKQLRRVPVGERSRLWVTDTGTLVLPAVRKSRYDKGKEGMSYYGQIKDKGKEALKFETTDTVYGSLTLSGDDHKKIPLHYANTDNVPVSDISKDVLSSMIRFSYQAKKHEKLSGIYGWVMMTKDLTRERQIADTNTFGEKVRQFGLGKLGIPLSDQVNAKKGVNSNSYKRLVKYIDMIYFGETKKKEGVELFGKKISLDKIADSLAAYTQFVALPGNMLQAIGDVINSKANIHIELAASQYLSKESYSAGHDKYWKHMRDGDFFQTFNDPFAKNKATLLIDMFDPKQDGTRSMSGKITGTGLKRNWTTDNAYFMQNLGSHVSQVALMFGFLEHTKVTTLKGEEISLYDALIVKDGILELRDDIDNQSDARALIRNTRHRLHSLSRSLFGNYSAVDKTAIEQQAWGRLVALFRKWMVPAYKRRFQGVKINYESMTVDEGYYNTLAYTADKLIRGSITGKIPLSQGIANLDQYQKDQLKKAISELGLIFVIYALFSALSNFKDDDDNAVQEWVENMTLYQLRRNFNELAVWTPIMPLVDFSENSLGLPFTIGVKTPMIDEASRFISSPTAAYKTFKNISKLGKQVFNPLEEYDRKTGRYDAGDLKISKRIEDLVPFWGRFQSSLTPEEALQWFNISSL